MKETYLIDDEIAYNDFVGYLNQEKPDKTFKEDIIEFPDFYIKVAPEYEKRVSNLFRDEIEACKETSFNIQDLETEIVENQGYKFVTFKGSK